MKLASYIKGLGQGIGLTRLDKQLIPLNGDLSNAFIQRLKLSVDQNRHGTAEASRRFQAVTQGGVGHKAKRVVPASMQYNRVLMADDSALTLDILKAALEKEGWQVATVTGGSLVLDRVMQGGIDIVVSDYHMPDADGLEVIQKVTGFDETIPVIILSGSGELMTAIGAMRAGAFDYVVKNNDVSAQLLAALEKAADHRRIELDNRRLTSELESERAQAERANDAKSAFLAAMSHELRTPLSAILGYARMVVEEGREMDLAEILEVAAKIARGGDHLLALINDILDLSKVEAGKEEFTIENFDLKQMLQEVVEFTAPLAVENQTTIKVEIKGRLKTIDSDKQKLKQCLINLVSNASRFTKDGEIKIVVSRSEDRKAIDIQVIDNGIGMPSEKAATIFEPFTQIKTPGVENHGGTGLGLTITQRYVERLGGQIFVESEDGVGSTFTIRLPNSN